MTGSFRRFERIAMAFCAGSLLLIPVYVLAHPPAGQIGQRLPACRRCPAAAASWPR